MHWIESLNDRERKEVDLARHYAANFAHGTTGHNQLMLLAKLAELLDAREPKATNLGSSAPTAPQT